MADAGLKPEKLSGSEMQRRNTWLARIGLGLQWLEEYLRSYVKVINMQVFPKEKYQKYFITCITFKTIDMLNCHFLENKE